MTHGVPKAVRIGPYAASSTTALGDHAGDRVTSIALRGEDEKGRHGAAYLMEQCRPNPEIAEHRRRRHHSWREPEE
jgi:hypothetical protein